MPDYHITLRSGHQTKIVLVNLSKPPEDFKTSEQFVAEIEGRERSLHVEIPIKKPGDKLYVAAD